MAPTAVISGCAAHGALQTCRVPPAGGSHITQVGAGGAVGTWWCVRWCARPHPQSSPLPPVCQVGLPAATRGADWHMSVAVYVRYWDALSHMEQGAWVTSLLNLVASSVADGGTAWQTVPAAPTTTGTPFTSCVYVSALRLVQQQGLVTIASSQGQCRSLWERGTGGLGGVQSQVALAAASRARALDGFVLTASRVMHTLCAGMYRDR